MLGTFLIHWTSQYGRHTACGLARAPLPAKEPRHKTTRDSLAQSGEQVTLGWPGLLVVERIASPNGCSHLLPSTTSACLSFCSFFFLSSSHFLDYTSTLFLPSLYSSRSLLFSFRWYVAAGHPLSSHGPYVGGVFSSDLLPSSDPPRYFLFIPCFLFDPDYRLSTSVRLFQNLRENSLPRLEPGCSTCGVSAVPSRRRGIPSIQPL